MSLQQQARALGDPTRFRIFEFIADASKPVEVAGLTEHLALNHNAIRQHLAKLVDAGLVDQGTRPATGPGRPRLTFRLNPIADGTWRSESPYQRLSLMLLETITTRAEPEQVGRRFGQSLTDRLPGSEESMVATLETSVARGGFDPRTRRSDNLVEFTLDNCPFADAAAVDSDTVCGLHRGLAQGLADQIDGVEFDDLIPQDPQYAGCKLRFGIEEPEAESNDIR